MHQFESPGPVSDHLDFSGPILYQSDPSWIQLTDYGRLVRKSPALHGQKSTPTPKFLGTAEAYFVCHIGPNFQISLIYAFIGCP